MLVQAAVRLVMLFPTVTTPACSAAMSRATPAALSFTAVSRVRQFPVRSVNRVSICSCSALRSARLSSRASWTPASEACLRSAKSREVPSLIW